MILEINNIIDQIKDELDKVTINTDVLRDLNKLINDKLDSIIELTTNKQVFCNLLYEAQRYNECYITLAYLQNKEIDEINDSIEIMFNKIKRIEDLLKDITLLNDNKRGVSNE